MPNVGNRVIYRLTARHEYPAVVASVSGERVDLNVIIPPEGTTRVHAIYWFADRKTAYDWIARGLSPDSRVCFMMEP